MLVALVEVVIQATQAAAEAVRERLERRGKLKLQVLAVLV
jgi:hypothetical protein